MNRRRPILFWPLVVLAVCTTIWWAFHVPRDTRRLYSAIPVQATFVSAHRDLAGRWGDVSSNPLTRAFFASANMGAKEWDGLNRDPQFRDWLTRLASDEFVMAYVPNLAEGEGGWVFTSWLGGRSQRLRLALQASTIPGIQFVGTRRGWPVWVTTSQMFKGGECLTFSLVEGMVVASYARSVHGIDAVLACVDGRYPSLRLYEDRGIPGATAPDRGWYRMPDSAKSIFDAPRAQFAITRFTATAIAAAVDIPYALLEGAQPIPPEAPASIAAWQTDLPAAILISPPLSATKWLQQTGHDAVTLALADIIAQHMTGPLYASLFTGDYRGSFLGMKLPALIVAATTTNSVTFPDTLQNHLVDINRQNQWGLKAVPDPVTPGILNIADTGDTLYAATADHGQAGFVNTTGTLIAASCLGAYSNVLRDAVLRENRPARIPLAARSAAQQNAAAYAWINLPESASAFRIGIGAYLARLRLENTPQSQALRAQINQTLAWVESLQTLGTVELAARPGEGSTHIELQTAPLAP